MISERGLVAVKKMGGETYITITDKGEDVSTKLLQDLITYEEIANLNKKTYDNDKFVSKGFRKDPGLEKVERKLAEKITEINFQFEDELRTIEDDD